MEHLGILVKGKVDIQERVVGQVGVVMKVKPGQVVIQVDQDILVLNSLGRQDTAEYQGIQGSVGIVVCQDIAVIHLFPAIQVSVDSRATQDSAVIPGSADTRGIRESVGIVVCQDIVAIHLSAGILAYQGIQV